MGSLHITRVVCWLTLAVSALAILPAHGVEQDLPGPVGGTPFERHFIVDDTGRKITYYMSRPKTAPAPLMLMIQGSGCVPVLNEQRGGAYSTLFDMLPFGQDRNAAFSEPFQADANRVAILFDLAVVYVLVADAERINNRRFRLDVE